MAHALYRFYGDAGRLLYVGITDDPSRRFGQHAGSKSWWHEVRGIAVDWYETREAVENAERRAISVEQPAHNKALRRRLVSVPRVIESGRDQHCLGDPEGCGTHADGVVCQKCGSASCSWKCGYDQGDMDGWRGLYQQFSYEIMVASMLSSVVDFGGIREPLF